MAQHILLLRILLILLSTQIPLMDLHHILNSILSNQTSTHQSSMVYEGITMQPFTHLALLQHHQISLQDKCLFLNISEQALL
jgi:hypothetical protein